MPHKLKKISKTLSFLVLRVVQLPGTRVSAILKSKYKIFLTVPLMTVIAPNGSGHLLNTSKGFVIILFMTGTNKLCPNTTHVIEIA